VPGSTNSPARVETRPDRPASTSPLDHATTADATPKQRNVHQDERVADDRCDLLCFELPRAEAIRATLDPALAERAATQAKSLGDPTRLLIGVALREGQELCVCDLAWIAGRAENLVGHHLRQLRAAGLARSRRDGKIVFYALTDTGLELVDVHLATADTIA
jgi:ArsR family transcriptional regulator, lead/cadmium/zinc/bismuth-responsive transcriptional repressor